jgi:hypothetical protein
MDFDCSLCNEKIYDFQDMSKTMIWGYVKYYHQSCATVLVKEKLLFLDRLRSLQQESVE